MAIPDRERVPYQRNLNRRRKRETSRNRRVRDGETRVRMVPALDVGTRVDESDVETYNGEYSAIIFCDEGMSELDQVLNYANGLKQTTRSYVKLKTTETLSKAMDLAAKYEVTHYVDETRTRQVHQETRRLQLAKNLAKEGGTKEKIFRCKGCFKPGTKPKYGKATRTCFYCKKPGHIKPDCHAWKKKQGEQGNEKQRHINVLSENPIVYKSYPLFSVGGEISVNGKNFSTSTMLLDSGATTVYVSKHWVEKNKLPTTKIDGKNVIAPGFGDLPERKVSRRKDLIRVEAPRSKRITDTPGVACGQLDRELDNGDSAEGSDKRSTLNKGATVKSSAGGKDSVMERMFTMGVVDAAGVETKHITWKKLRKFLRIKTKTSDEPDFMLVLSNNKIKRVASTLQRRDQPDSVGSERLNVIWIQIGIAFELIQSTSY
ncbi:hypothetical protein L914_08028 [Phytophthora nicotianae]|uniref:CCHC-type domain-containing protein n=1 Tax=Phytophthora nicotianae TaxID=4792 RepID=W2NFB6_PHYNI|nr:hypothetical protein L914_08028 [Phytophthora nicotianae]